MGITKAKRPANVSPAAIDSFISGGLGAPEPAPVAADPAAARAPIEPKTSGGRKKPISLTIEPTLLVELDQTAAGLGISRAAAFSLAVSRFVASEKRGAQ